MNLKDFAREMVKEGAAGILNRIGTGFSKYLRNVSGRETEALGGQLNKVKSQIGETAGAAGPETTQALQGLGLKQNRLEQRLGAAKKSQHTARVLTGVGAGGLAAGYMLRGNNNNQ